MSLADDLAGIPEKPLSLTEAIEALDPKDREALAAAIQNPRVGSPAIVAVLAKHGIKVSSSGLNKYRADNYGS